MFHALLTAASLAIVLLVLGPPTPAHAATISVTTEVDENGANNAACSLREAIQAANTDSAVGGCTAGSGTDEITFAASTNGQTILLTNGQIQITSSLRIAGNGATQTRIDGQRGTGTATRVFDITAGNTVTIDAVTVQNGSTVGLGAGVQNAGTLTVTSSIFSGNEAGNGGGIANLAGGTLNVSNSTFSGNSASAVGGGGIITFGALTLRNSTVSNNSAPVNGGGINLQPGGAATIVNSTVSGNTSGGLGGGISSLGSVTIVNSTIRNNNGSNGDGIATSNPNVQLRATIMANAANGENCSPSGVVSTSLGSNVADDSSCFAGAGSDQVVADVMLGPLANNGGPTQTHALLAGSPAIDAVQGPCTENGTAGGTAITTDQRGRPRPGGLRCDAGAFEQAFGVLQFDSATYSVNESGGTATITITRTGGLDGTVGATVSLTNGTATAPADYSNAPLSVSFSDGQSSQTVQIPVVNDTLPEDDETVNLSLGNPTGGATIGAQGTAVLTIQDDDGASRLSIDDVTIPEGNSGTTNATFTVTLAPASGQTVTVQAATANRTATAGSDYVATSQTLTFAPGETSKTFTVPVIGDVDVEPDETFAVTLTNASNASIADNQGLGTIRNDDASSNDPNNSGSGDKKDKDEQDKETEDERRQRERTNAGNRDDVHTEGTVLSVGPAPNGDGILVEIGLGRGGAERVTVFIRCGAGECPAPRPGDYLEADGYLNDKQETGNTWFVADEAWEFSPKR